MTDGNEVDRSSADQELRQRAVQRLRARAGFWTHLLVYLTINALTVVVWAVTGNGFFWPIFLIVLWGMGVVANAWDVFGPAPVTEDRVRREMDRLRRTAS